VSAFSYRVWKFVVPRVDIETGESLVEMPDSAQILSAGLQVGEVVVWASVTHEVPLRKRRILVINTGTPASAFPGRFIATVTSSNGIVWHIFDRGWAE
jgi:hypothetical protein